MTQKIRKERITKAEWYDLGGFEHPALFRQQSRGGAWRYYKRIDRPQFIEPPAITEDIYATMARHIESVKEITGINRTLGKSAVLGVGYKKPPVADS